MWRRLAQTAIHLILFSSRASKAEMSTTFFLPDKLPQSRRQGFSTLVAVWEQTDEPTVTLITIRRKEQERLIGGRLGLYLRWFGWISHLLIYTKKATRNTLTFTSEVTYCTTNPNVSLWICVSFTPTALAFTEQKHQIWSLTGCCKWNWSVD